jgi:hypothetical protein
MKLSRVPMFVLVSMDRYCQERAKQVLNDSAAGGTFLLNDEEIVSRSMCFATAKNETTYRCSQRTTLGDMPVIRRKCRAKWLWSANPADSAISAIGRSVLRSICWACSMRRCST